MAGQQVGYIRVSSHDQNTDRQLADIKLDEIFKDSCSGKDTNRPGLSACLRHLRKKDVLHVHSIDRLARDLADLQQIITDLTQREVTVKFHSENMTFTGDSDPMQTLMLQMMGAFAQFERSMIRERQREGIAAARKAGKQIGAQRKLTKDQIQAIKQRIDAREKVTVLAKEYQVSRQTIYSAIKHFHCEASA